MRLLLCEPLSTRPKYVKEVLLVWIALPVSVDTGKTIALSFPTLQGHQRIECLSGRFTGFQGNVIYYHFVPFSVQN